MVLNLKTITFTVTVKGEDVDAVKEAFEEMVEDFMEEPEVCQGLTTVRNANSKEELDFLAEHDYDVEDDDETNCC